MHGQSLFGVCFEDLNEPRDELHEVLMGDELQPRLPQAMWLGAELLDHGHHSRRVLDTRDVLLTVDQVVNLHHKPWCY
jgi:hypothetical protein